jgi:hypothetical protein
MPGGGAASSYTTSAPSPRSAWLDALHIAKSDEGERRREARWAIRISVPELA